MSDLEAELHRRAPGADSTPLTVRSGRHGDRAPLDM